MATHPREWKKRFKQQDGPSEFLADDGWGWGRLGVKAVCKCNFFTDCQIRIIYLGQILYDKIQSTQWPFSHSPCKKIKFCQNKLKIEINFFAWKFLSFGVLARSANQLSKYQINRIPNIWHDANQGGSEVKENQSAKICVKMASVTDDNLTVQLS